MSGAAIAVSAFVVGLIVGAVLTFWIAYERAEALARREVMGDRPE